MKLTTDERVLYSNAVWLTFCNRRGSEMPAMSTAEFDLIRRWIDGGICLASVLQAIEDMGGKPRTLLACERPVAEEHARTFHALNEGGELPL